MTRLQLYAAIGVLAALVALGLLVGCVPSPLVEAIDDHQDQLIDEALLAEYRLQSPRTPRLFHDADEAWLGGPVATLRRPADPRLDVTYAFSSSSGTTLQQIASDITVITGHPVSLSPDLYIARVQRAGVRLRGGGDAFVTSEPADEDALPSIVNRAITYRHNGPLHEFLDRVATELGITWRWDSGRIVFERFVTRTFRVALLPGTVTSELTLTGTAVTTAVALATAGAEEGASTTQSGGDAPLSGSTQSTALSTTIDPWPALTAAVSAMLSPAGELVASSSLGTLTVRDVPAAVDAIAAYLEVENRYLTRMVNFEIRLLGIRTDESSDHAIDWTLVRSGGIGITVGAPDTSPAAGAGGVAVSVLRPTSRLQGTAVIARALRARNTVTSDTVFRAVGLSNSIIPVQLTSTDGYTAAHAITLPETGDPIEVSTAGRITTGTVMQLMPRLMTDEELLLRINLDLSTLLGRRDLPGGVQVPITRQQAIAPTATVRSGDILILDSFAEDVEERRDQGLHDAVPWWAGGQRTASRYRTHLVLIVRPTLVNTLDRSL